ncbi:MAG: hypothetical protein Q8Q09_05685 [Deltaproteobacteria bacterium]|nr:hypothetical protein [Deltaproteobacteria bacterium]
MREAEIAAITETFFETEFAEYDAQALLGAAFERQEHEGREFVYLRPDARTLVRVDLAIRPPKPGESMLGSDGELYAAEPFIEELVLILRASTPYSRQSLESMFGPARLSEGPINEDGDPSLQLTFDYVGSFTGQLMIRWWREPIDPPNMGRPNGPDEVRVEEFHLTRLPFGSEPEEEVAMDELLEDDLEDANSGQWNMDPEAFADAMTVGSSQANPETMNRETVPPMVAVQFSIDDAMEAGVWLADLSWRILRADFTVDRALDTLGLPEGPLGDGEAVSLTPLDARLGGVTIVPRGERVGQAVLYPHSDPPMVVAIDALTDRFGAEPSHAMGSVSFRMEGTRSRGTVVVHGNELRTGLWAVSVVDLHRN